MTQILTWTIPLLKGVVFVRRPVSMTPRDGAICFVDDGTDSGFKRQIVGRWEGGAWDNGKGRALPIVPTFYTVMETPGAQ